MSASELVRRLNARGVRLEARDGRLRVDAPSGALTDEDYRELGARRAELLALLAGAHGPAPGIGPDPGAPADAACPAPPPGARLFFEDQDGRPCGPGDEVHLWTWEGASCWYYADVLPPPGAGRARRS